MVEFYGKQNLHLICKPGNDLMYYDYYNIIFTEFLQDLSRVKR